MPWTSAPPYQPCTTIAAVMIARPMIMPGPRSSSGWRHAQIPRPSAPTPIPVPNGLAIPGQSFATPFVTPPRESFAPPAPATPAITPPVVHSERLGSVHVAVEQSGDAVRVTLGLAAAAVPLVGADVPRLAADLAAQGHRLQALEFDGGGSNGAGSGVSYGGSNGGGAARQDQPPPASAPDPAHRDRRAATAADVAMTSLPATADRYA